MSFEKGAAFALAMMFACLANNARAQEPALPGPTQNIQNPGVGTVSAAPPVHIPNSGEKPGVANTSVADAPIEETYRLGAGDKMKITVYGEQDMSGEFSVNASGRVQFPLLGEIRAAGLTVQGFKQSLEKELGAKYLRDPNVSIEVENYRPFYIIGEVNKPGEYPYESGLSLQSAVALAGGFTYRANDSSVYIRRVGADAETSMRVTGQIKIYPGDVVRVPERIF
jgi:protein involved in polysaccharide export with SLBB domain